MPERVENLMSGTYEHNKIKTPYAHIIVEGTCEKPYFEIEYYDPEKETTFIGYGSYDLSNVFRWLEENFEVEKPTADIAPVVHGTPISKIRPQKYEIYEEAGTGENGEILYHKRIYVDEKNSVEYCPACNKRLSSRFRSFCPNCGAKMDLEDDK